MSIEPVTDSQDSAVRMRRRDRVRQWGYHRNARMVARIFWAIIWIGALIVGGRESGVDDMLLRAFYATPGSAMSNFAWAVSFFGSWKFLMPLGLLACAYLAFARGYRAVLLLLVLAGGRVLIDLQKLVFSRTRPGESPFLESVSTLSFPSAHAGNAMITFVALAMLLPTPHRYRFVLIGMAAAFAVLIGWSRVALGVHWPTDVVGGWAFGILWVGIMVKLASHRPGLTRSEA